MLNIYLLLIIVTSQIRSLRFCLSSVVPLIASLCLIDRVILTSYFEVIASIISSFFYIQIFSPVSLYQRCKCCQPLHLLTHLLYDVIHCCVILVWRMCLLQPAASQAHMIPLCFLFSPSQPFEASDLLLGLNFSKVLSSLVALNKVTAGQSTLKHLS